MFKKQWLKSQYGMSDKIYIIQKPMCSLMLMRRIFFTRQSKINFQRVNLHQYRVKPFYQLIHIFLVTIYLFFTSQIFRASKFPPDQQPAHPHYTTCILYFSTKIAHENCQIPEMFTSSLLFHQPDLRTSKFPPNKQPAQTKEKRAPGGGDDDSWKV